MASESSNGNIQLSGGMQNEEIETSQDLEDDSRDYEPRIHTAGKPQSAKKEPQTLVRPRYFSTELGIKDKIFVAVLSSLKQISSLGVAVNETLAPNVNRLAFFVDMSTQEKLDVKTLPVVGFQDNQQGLLTLHTLKYLAEKLLSGYSFFFLIRDTSFVSGRKLANFINHISITNHVYLGMPVEDRLFSEPVCSLDGGIIISSSVLSALAPILESCTEELLFNSDDEKIGLCIFKALNLTCQSNLQVNTSKMKDTKFVRLIPTELSFYRDSNTRPTVWKRMILKTCLELGIRIEIYKVHLRFTRPTRRLISICSTNCRAV